MAYDSCSCDYDAPSFHDVTTPKARKPYRCCECAAAIAIGDQYERTVGKWDGEVSTYKTCGLCAELRQWAQISVPCFCWIYGSLHENVRNMVEEVRFDVPKGFVLEWGRRLIQIQRRRYDEHWPRKFLRFRPRRSALQIVSEDRP